VFLFYRAEQGIREAHGAACLFKERAVMAKRPTTLALTDTTQLSNFQASDERLIHVDPTGAPGDIEITLPNNPIDGQSCFIKRKGGGPNGITLTPGSVPAGTTIETGSLANDDEVTHLCYDAKGNEWVNLARVEV